MWTPVKIPGGKRSVYGLGFGVLLVHGG